MLCTLTPAVFGSSSHRCEQSHRPKLLQVWLVKSEYQYTTERTASAEHRTNNKNVLFWMIFAELDVRTECLHLFGQSHRPKARLLWQLSRGDCRNVGLCRNGGFTCRWPMLYHWFFVISTLKGRNKRFINRGTGIPLHSQHSVFVVSIYAVSENYLINSSKQGKNTWKASQIWVLAYSLKKSQISFL